MATNPLFWVHPSKYLIQSMDMVMYMYIDIYIYRFTSRYWPLTVPRMHMQAVSKKCCCFFSNENLCSHVELKNKSDPLSLCSQVCSKS